jgi:hypothetical protein
MRLSSFIFSMVKLRLNFLLVIVCLVLVGCHSRSISSQPSLQITQVPVANAGGPVQMSYIVGRANGAQPGQQIVLYARSDLWWIQPFANQPFTKIQPDATWKNSTHQGTEYAALLVDSSYKPASKLTELPAKGNGVIATAVAKGTPAAPIVSKIIHFSGYDWRVRAAASDRGGQPNFYDPANAWTDKKGYLHLRMEEHDGTWSCAELTMTRSLGYGSYMFVVQDSRHLGPSAVVGLYTADDLRMDDIRSELDVELSQWGDPSSRNAQFVVQPFYVPENVARFTAPGGRMSYMFRWEPGRASFKAIRGAASSAEAAPLSEHVFTSGVPTPAKETVHIDLYDYHHSKSSLQQAAEVVIEKFEFLP